MRTRQEKAILLILMLLVVSAIVAGTALAGQQSTQSIYRNLGQIQRELFSETKTATANDTYAVGAHICISRAEYENLARQIALVDSEASAAERARNILIEQRVLSYAASQAGIFVSDELVQKQIADTRAGIKVAENKADYEALLDGLGMTDDEYWATQTEIVRTTAAIALYQEHCRDSFFKQEQTATEEDWNSWWETHVTGLITAENITTVTENDIE